MRAYLRRRQTRPVILDHRVNKVVGEGADRPIHRSNPQRFSPQNRLLTLRQYYWADCHG
jgi:hypothetical protein